MFFKNKLGRMITIGCLCVALVCTAVVVPVVTVLGGTNGPNGPRMQSGTYKFREVSLNGNALNQDTDINSMLEQMLDPVLPILITNLREQAPQLLSTLLVDGARDIFELGDLNSNEVLTTVRSILISQLQGGAVDFLTSGLPNSIPMSVIQDAIFNVLESSIDGIEELVVGEGRDAFPIGAVLAPIMRVFLSDELETNPRFRDSSGNLLQGEARFRMIMQYALAEAMGNRAFFNFVIDQVDNMDIGSILGGGIMGMLGNLFAPGLIGGTINQLVNMQVYGGAMVEMWRHAQPEAFARWEAQWNPHHRTYRAWTERSWTDPNTYRNRAEAVIRQHTHQLLWPMGDANMLPLNWNSVRTHFNNIPNFNPRMTGANSLAAQNPRVNSIINLPAIEDALLFELDAQGRRIPAPTVYQYRIKADYNPWFRYMLWHRPGISGRATYATNWLGAYSQPATLSYNSNYRLYREWLVGNDVAWNTGNNHGARRMVNNGRLGWVDNSPGNNTWYRHFSNEGFCLWQNSPRPQRGAGASQHGTLAFQKFEYSNWTRRAGINAMANANIFSNNPARSGGLYSITQDDVNRMRNHYGVAQNMNLQQFVRHMAGREGSPIMEDYWAQFAPGMIYHGVLEIMDLGTIAVIQFPLFDMMFDMLPMMLDMFMELPAGVEPMPMLRNLVDTALENGTGRDIQLGATIEAAMPLISAVLGSEDSDDYSFEADLLMLGWQLDLLFRGSIGDDFNLEGMVRALDRIVGFEAILGFDARLDDFMPIVHLVEAILRQNDERGTAEIEAALRNIRLPLIWEALEPFLPMLFDLLGDEPMEIEIVEGFSLTLNLANLDFAQLIVLIDQLDMLLLEDGMGDFRLSTTLDALLGLGVLDQQELQPILSIVQLDEITRLVDMIMFDEIQGEDFVQEIVTELIEFVSSLDLVQLFHDLQGLVAMFAPEIDLLAEIDLTEEMVVEILTLVQTLLSGEPEDIQTREIIGIFDLFDIDLAILMGGVIEMVSSTAELLSFDVTGNRFQINGVRNLINTFITEETDAELSAMLNTVYNAVLNFALRTVTYTLNEDGNVALYAAAFTWTPEPIVQHILNAMGGMVDLGPINELLDLATAEIVYTNEDNIIDINFGVDLFGMLPFVLDMVDIPLVNLTLFMGLFAGIEMPISLGMQFARV